MNRFLLLALLLGPSLQAHARTWTIIGSGSALDFNTTFEGAPLHGRFGHFSGRITLDAERPQACRFDVSIRLASADTGNSTGNRQVQGKAFFDSAAHPVAYYRARHCRWNGKGPIVVQGTLSLRGKRKSVPLHAVLHVSRDHASLSATAKVNRLAFGVGQGQWSSPSVVGTEVGIKAHLRLVPATH